MATLDGNLNLEQADAKVISPPALLSAPIDSSRPWAASTGLQTEAMPLDFRT